MQQQYDYEELLEFCKAILPKTWHAYKYCDVGNAIYDKGILNIELHRYNKIGYNNDNSCCGHVRSIFYLNGVGFIKISLHCNPVYEKSVLIH